MKVKSSFTLDVGCGSLPRGDINIDVIRYDYENFVLADARHLPFKDKVFTHLMVYNVLEHLPNVSNALAECHRVSENVEVRADSIFSLANWFYFEHQQLTVGLRFIPRPRILKLLGKLIYQVTDRHYDHEGLLYSWLKPFLIKAKLLDNFRIYHF